MNDFASRLRRVARTLRWAVGTMVLSFGVAWFAAARSMIALLRIALLAGAAAFFVATLCFVWLAWQAVVQRRQPRPPRCEEP
jgi:hypothetical protein